MNILRLVCVAVLLLGFAIINNDVKADTIVVAAANWQGVSEPEGKGIYLELISAIYQNDNVQFDVSTYGRAKKLMERGEVDILVGAYKEEFPAPHYAHWHLDMESPIIAIFNTDKMVMSSTDDLENKVVAWVKGYNFQDYLERPVHHYAVDNFFDALTLLNHGKVDVVLDYDYNIPSDEVISLGRFEVVDAKPIWLVFQNNQRGSELKLRYDQGIERLRSNGQLATIYGDAFVSGGFNLP